MSSSYDIVRIKLSLILNSKYFKFMSNLILVINFLMLTMDAYLIEWFDWVQVQYLHYTNLVFAYIYLIIGILHLIRRMMLFFRNEAKLKRKRLLRKYKTDLVTLEKIHSTKEKNWLRRLVGPVVHSIPTATMAISALSSLVYIILTTTFEEFSPPPLQSYV